MHSYHAAVVYFKEERSFKTRSFRIIMLKNRKILLDNHHLGKYV